MANQTQDQIARKYGPAIDEMHSQGVRVTEMTMHGDRLYILGWAPSQEVKNRIWDRIKSIDPNYSDLECDIRLEQDAQQVLDQAAQGAPKSSIAAGLASAFRSNQTPSFGQTLAHLFEHSDGQQRAGLLNSLFSTSPGGVASEVAGMFGGKKQITPEDAQNISPDVVRRLGEQAEKSNPSIIDRVSEFYAGHPGVVKTLGVGALTMVASKIIGGLRSRSGGAS